MNTAIPPLTDWMGSLLYPDNLVSRLSIPGTHDSCAISVVAVVRTQTLSITEQLNAGIRFFDIRANFKIYLRPKPPYFLHVVHDVYDLGILLIDVLQQMYDWLDSHPNEGIILQIKRDGTLPTGLTEADFAENFFDLVTKKSNYWRTGTTVPRVKEIKGKIQLIRRFRLVGNVPPVANAGLDVNKWANNSDLFQIAATKGNPAYNVTVQDHYQYVWADGDAEIVIKDKKFEKAVEPLLIAASSNQSADMWYYNYASATRFTVGSEILNPWDFAQGPYAPPLHIKGINQRLVEFFEKNARPKRYGVIMLDFPTDENSPTLVRKIIENNDF